jgi:O-acetyl-ADP-ribose deacetylase (regulator of RNase III)
MSLDASTVVAAAGILVAVGTLVATAVVAITQQRHRAPGNAEASAVVRSPNDAIPFIEATTFRLDATDRRVGLITGDMMRINCVDIWVNPENTDMEMARSNDFSVSGMIRYWGAERDERSGALERDLIADELRSVVGTGAPVAPGSAFATGPGKLRESNNVKFVIHVAAVQGEPGAGFRQVQNVGQCVTNALNRADEIAARSSDVSSILFPLLGTGTGGADVGSTVRRLVGAAISYYDSTPRAPIKTIYFLAYSHSDREALLAVLRGTARFVIDS